MEKNEKENSESNINHEYDQSNSSLSNKGSHFYNEIEELDEEILEIQKVIVNELKNS